MLGSNIAMIAYLITVRPFREENQQTTTVIDELVIMVVLCMFLAYVFKPSMNGTERTNLGWVIIGLICFSVIKNFTVVIYFGV